MKRLLAFPAALIMMIVLAGCPEALPEEADPATVNGTVEATASGPMSDERLRNAKIAAEKFWASKGELGSCMDNDLRFTQAGPDEVQRARDDNGTLFSMSFRQYAQALRDQGYNVRGIKAWTFGCNTPGYHSVSQGGQISDPRVVYNTSYGWGRKRACRTGSHEMGHARGFTHSNTGGYRIMQIPLPETFTPCE